MSFNTAKNKPLYSIWAGIKGRCYTKTNRSYDLYGGRGITVCERWLNDYKTFEADLMPRPARASLDRIDPNGPYEPANCRWATPKMQAINRRVTRTITIEGTEYVACTLAESIDMKTETLIKRAESGMSYAAVMRGDRIPVHDLRPFIAKANQANIDRCADLAHCKRGHSYIEFPPRITKEGWRECRECRRIKAAARRLNAGVTPQMKKPNHCINGHEYTEENTWHNAKGSRLCKICRAASKKRSAERKKAANG